LEKHTIDYATRDERGGQPNALSHFSHDKNGGFTPKNNFGLISEVVEERRMTFIVGGGGALPQSEAVI